MNQPLFAKRIVITRTEEQSTDFINELSKHGAQVISFPTISIIEPESWDALDKTLAQLDKYDWLFFTSANGVKYFWNRFKSRNCDEAVLNKLSICAIGKATAATLQQLGIKVDLIPQEFKSEGVIEGLIKFSGNIVNLRGKKVLLPRARIARDTLIVELKKLGVYVDAVEVYQTICPQQDVEFWMNNFSSNPINIITFTSASTVKNFANIFSKEKMLDLLKNVTVACIGPITANAATELGLCVKIQPAEYTTKALVKSILNYFTENNFIK